MSESIGVPDWMSASATTAVMDALEAAGGPGCARFVGGCVRNEVMGIAIDDVDIATPLAPEAVMAALKAAGLRAVPTGLEHGTVTAISESRPFEITTLRRDVSTDGRRAVVAFTDDWREDAERRDFRFNSLYCDRVGAVFDPTGEGVADARAGRVVFVGDAQTRIREDYLRILRLFRFHAWYGKDGPDPAAVAACTALRGELKSLSNERVAKELLKTLGARDPRGALALMRRTAVLAEVLSEADEGERLDRLVSIELAEGWPTDAELRFAAFMPDAALASTAARRLRFSNAQHDRIVAAVGPEPAIAAEIDDPGARRAIYAAGALSFADRVKLAWAVHGGPAQRWRALLEIGRSWRAPALPVGGRDAAALGLSGPAVGQALKAVEAWWIAADFPDDRAAALQQLEAAARG